MLPQLQTSLHPLPSSDFSIRSSKLRKPLNNQSSLPPKPFLKKPKFPEVPRNEVKIHLSCSNAMRTTQYNKLVNEVSKFDTQRIRKAIKEGRIESMIRTERNNPAVARTIGKSNKFFMRVILFGIVASVFVLETFDV
jgi:hypothetical protein